MTDDTTPLHGLAPREVLLLAYLVGRAHGAGEVGADEIAAESLADLGAEDLIASLVARGLVTTDRDRWCIAEAGEQWFLAFIRANPADRLDGVA